MTESKIYIGKNIFFADIIFLQNFLKWLLRVYNLNRYELLIAKVVKTVFYFCFETQSYKVTKTPPQIQNGTIIWHGV